jgi:DNA-binding transcriptional LysR family regulator
MSADELTLNDANVFAAVVRSGSFAGAARTMNLSQSVASRAVARLEKHLGVRVLDRTTRSVALTDEGRLLFERLEPLLDGFEETFAFLAEKQSKIHGTLRVKIHSVLSHVIPSNHLKKFLETHPDLSVELISSDRVGDLINEGIDLALTVGDLPPSSFVAKRLLNSRVITVASPEYIKRFGSISHPTDLANGGHTLIDYRNPETGRPFLWEHHRGRKIVKTATSGTLIVSDIVSLHGICMAGWGIAQVLEIAVRPLLASGALVDVLPEWGDERFPIHAIYPSRSYVPPRTRAFLDFVSSAVL